jgi:hypothetical protein
MVLPKAFIKHAQQDAEPQNKNKKTQLNCLFVANVGIMIYQSSKVVKSFHTLFDAAKVHENHISISLLLLVAEGNSK